MNKIIKLESITAVHKLLGAGKPQHPLITVIRNSERNTNAIEIDKSYSLGFYTIMLKEKQASFKYGRNSYDFEEGTLLATAPGQVLSVNNIKEGEIDKDGWVLFFHPDLIRKSHLGREINQCGFFRYDANEALHLSDQEKKTISDCIDKIILEYSQNIDNHSQTVIVSNIVLLLNYCTRFYDRQFITRTNRNKDIVSRLEEYLHGYFSSDSAKLKGLPTVGLCAEEISLSPHYLSDLLKKETGKNTQEHIHYFVIELAKNRLLGSTETISEIAYGLGFEYPSYFTKIFKAKTGLTPAMYRSQN